MGKIINAAIAGFGKAGEVFHSPFINAADNIKLTSVLERSRKRSQELFPWVKVVTSYSDILTDKEVDLIVITTPNDLHFSMAKDALLAGKHVVADKPFTITSFEADELIALAREKNLVLTVYHNRRLDGTFQAIKKAVQNKSVGEVKKLTIRFDRFRPEVNKESWRETPRAGSGLLYDLGSHLIDQALNLFGWPDEIKSEVKSERTEALSDDFFEIQFIYNSGIEVVLTAGMLVKEKTPHYVLEGTKGKLIIQDLDPQEAALKNNVFPGNREYPKTCSGTLISSTGTEEKIEFPAGNYTDFYTNLGDVINGKTKLLIKPEEARDVIRVIEKSTR
jgi:scyllo-inositol 2-dehydrogenase (NADP+)